MRAERVGAETLLAQIVKMVSEAQRARAPIQRLADQVAGYFVPAVIAAAAVAFAAWAVWGPEPRLAHALVIGGGGADYCVSVCAGAGDADVDDGGDGARSACGCSDAECGGAGDAGEGRYAGD